MANLDIIISKGHNKARKFRKHHFEVFTNRKEKAHQREHIFFVDNRRLVPQTKEEKGDIILM